MIKYIAEHKNPNMLFFFYILNWKNKLNAGFLSIGNKFDLPEEEFNSTIPHYMNSLLG